MGRYSVASSPDSLERSEYKVNLPPPTLRPFAAQSVRRTSKDTIISSNETSTRTPPVLLRQAPEKFVSPPVLTSLEYGNGSEW
ncbi:hypothetical protein AGDE_17174 [Angomonas deanei]|nr:hypothetical protein AGDE_17174 [Angomonas deanei]|eukprot:EPY15104.1 hypothetical protein AGDE_17174 [Angomonas deanei]